MPNKKSGRIAVLALAGAALGTGAVLGGHAGLASASAQTGLTASAATAMAGPAKPGVDPVATGWTAAIRHQTSHDDGLGELVVVSPEGVVRTLGAVADYEAVTDVRLDGAYVLTSRYLGEGTMQATVWAAATGKSTTFTYGYNPMYQAAVLGFAGDSGLVVMTTSGLHSFSLDGTQGASLDIPVGGYTFSPDGSTIYSSRSYGDTDETITAYNSSTGAVKGTWAIPSSQADAIDCTVDQVWDASSAALDCRGIGSDNLQEHQSFLLGAGGAVSELTPARSAFALPTLTQQTGWRVDPSGPCNQFGVLVGSELRAVPTMPIADCAAHYRVSGAAGRYAYVVQFTYGEVTSGTLKRYDATANRVTVVLGAEATDSAARGLVTTAQTVDGHH